MNDGPSIISSMRSLCRVIAPSGNMISGRRRSTRMSIAVSIAWRSLPSRKTLNAPIRRDHERLEPALLEHVPTGHREQMAIGLHAQDAEHERIGHAAMVGREHDAMPRGERGAEPLHMPAFDRVNAVTPCASSAADTGEGAIGHHSEYTGGTNSYGSSMTTFCMAIRGRAREVSQSGTTGRRGDSIPNASRLCPGQTQPEAGCR